MLGKHWRRQLYQERLEQPYSLEELLVGVLGGEALSAHAGRKNTNLQIGLELHFHSTVLCMRCMCRKVYLGHLLQHTLADECALYSIDVVQVFMPYCPAAVGTAASGTF